jgi:hypothetical protein
MPLPSAQPLDQPKTELETVLNWPLIGLGAGLAMLLLGVSLTCLWCSISQRTKGDLEPQTHRAPPPARQDRAVASLSRQALTPVRRAEPEVRPASDRAPVAPDSRPPEIKTSPRPQPAIPAKEKTTPVAPPLAVDRPLPAQPEPVSVPPRFKRRDVASEPELLYRLLTEVPEADLDAVAGSSAKILSAAKGGTSSEPKNGAKAASSAAHPTLAHVKDRRDLAGLPMRGEKECVKEAKAAKQMGELSRRLRTKLGRLEGPARPSLSQRDTWSRDAAIMALLPEGDGKYDADQLTTLVQMLQIESRYVRLHLIKLLAASKDKQASILLARSAIFDLADGVREAAVEALKTRPRAEYREVLLAGLRYPWALVADHAAEALAGVKDSDALSDLAGLLDQPDPAALFLNRDKKWVMPELVRVNHFRNCLLCHAPSLSTADPVTGPVPTPGEPLPVVYYEKVRSRSARVNFVRADVTYLRQDFSVLQPVENPDRWPWLQRYDYVIRLRELSTLERDAREHAEVPASYPQREAVLFALREVTGQDAGATSEAWRRCLRELRPKALP